MADLNEPKKETERIGLSPPAGAKPPTGSLRPPPPPSVAPRPLPSKEEVAAGPRPPAPPMTRPSAPAPSGAARPPNGPPPPTGAKASVPPPPPLGLIPPSPSPVALSPGAPGSSKPGLSPINRPLENRGLLQAGPRQETACVADSPMKAAREAGQRAARQCAVGTDHPRRVAGSCELAGQRLRCISSGSAVLGLARYFRADLAPATLELFLLIKSWKILWRSQSTNQILTAK